MTDSHLQAFANEARRYCDWAITGHDEDWNAATALRRLVSLYASALDLPASGGTPSETTPLVDIDQERARVAAASAALPLQYYGQQSDPSLLPATNEAVLGDLADDVSDVFADVRHGLWLFDQGREREALGEWVWSFQKHWGEHAVSAIRALHIYLGEQQWNDRMRKAGSREPEAAGSQGSCGPLDSHAA